MAKRKQQRKDQRYRYRRLFVEDGDIVEIPEGARGVHIRPVSKKTDSFVEWLEPIKEEEKEA